MPPSSKSMLRDPHPPTSFSMDQWTAARNFLYYFGKMYRHTVRVKGGDMQFQDPRAIALYIGRSMNIFQEDYSDRLSQVSLQGRLVAEATVEFLAPVEGYQGKKLVGEKLSVLEASSHLNKTCFGKDILPLLRKINSMGIAGVHFTRERISPEEKPVMADHVYRVCRFLVSYIEERWAAEALEVNRKASSKIAQAIIPQPQ